MPDRAGSPQPAKSKRNGDWTPAATATKSKATVGGLTSGTRYWFRVAAIGSAGQDPWSNPATAIAS